MSFFLPWENWEKVIGLYVVFFAVGKLGKKSQVCMSFFLPSENWEKSHRFVCRFFCRPKTGKKVIGLYVVFYVGRRKTGLGLGFRVRV